MKFHLDRYYQTMTKSALLIIVVTGLLGLPDCTSRESQDDTSSHQYGERNITRAGADSVLQRSDINCIFQDRRGNYWFGTDGHGVCRYDGRVVTRFTVDNGMCSNFVWTVTEDTTGKIWFGTRDGICRYDGTSFTSFTSTDGVRTNSPDRSVEYQAGSLWFGRRDGVYRYDGTSLASFAIHPASYQPPPSSMNRPYAIYSILEDKGGNLWFGTEQKGVCRYDGKDFTWFTEEGLNRAAVRCIFQDSKGNIWFSNNGAGVCRYDGTSLINVTEEEGLSNEDFLKTSRIKDTPGTLARVFTIAEDDTGNLWFGTIDAGVWRYDGASLTNFTAEDGLGSNTVRAIYKDNAGTLWFGTNGAGIRRYNGTSFVDFTENEVE
jgi:ligand-binding sensor domain-containing protein